MKSFFSFLFILCCFTSFAQTTVSGRVVDSKNMPIPGVNILVFGTTQGTATDLDGRFSFVVTEDPPFSLAVSSMGYEEKRIQVTEKDAILEIVLTEGTSLDEIVVSASRTPERIFESPVTIEYFGIKEIRNTPSASFYGGLENLKGVDINTNSLTFQSVNTRGFATFNNTRFVQLVDGMDNSAPALNFVLGNLLGMTELDVYSVELLPGASSALYGANAFNGILFMKSKSPFTFPGISAYYKQGMTVQDAAGTNPYYDFGVRIAHKFSDKFAAKANFSYLKGTDWYAVSEEDVLNPGRDRTHPNYDGLNIYGDEVSTNLREVGVALANLDRIPMGAENLLPDVSVSRTGYLEPALTDYDAESIKFDAALHYRPFADDFEISYLGKAGVGATIYQGANRYSLKNFFLQQHKLEVSNSNFFVRGYITDEDAGDSYDMRFTAININRRWKTDQQWFGEYAGAFIQSTLAGLGPDQAHAVARQTADTGRLMPGTPEFQSAFDEVTSDPDLASGSQFRDASQLRHADANYNFTHLTEDIAEIQVGGSLREYRLNSSGTIFTDEDGPISYSEYGIYTQVQKKLVDERLKLTGSIRYDKSELFEGNFSPRLSAGYSAGTTRDHNIRASVQTGFRYPTTQDLFIGLDVGRAILVGSAEANLDRYVRTFPLSGSGIEEIGSETVTITGRSAYENAFSVASVLAGDPEAADVEIVKPEQVTAYEIGYRGRVGRVIIDWNAYYNTYQDFISSENVLVPLYGDVDGAAEARGQALRALGRGDTRVYQVYTNSPADVKSFGTSIGLSTKVFGDFDLEGNYTFAEEDFDQASAPDFRTNFNTPKHKVKVSFGNTDVYENLGFNINYRWSDAFLWEGSFADGAVPEFHVFDAQVNYRIPSWNSTIKAGGTNIGGKEYYTAYGTGLIGQIYYVSFTYNSL